MLRTLCLFLSFLSFTYAKTYNLHLASTKYLDVAKNYYHDIKFHTPDFYNVVIRIHEKKNYSVIIRNIPNIDKVKRVEKLIHAAGKYKDSYIKAYKVEPNYRTFNMQDKIVFIGSKKEIFKQKTEDTNEYITASTMYNTGLYAKSYKMFYKLFLKNNYNKNINFFLARSAFNLKKYDEATAAYERVLILEPDFHQARYDYARILYKLKYKEDAKKEFDKLLNTNIKSNIKEKIKKFLKILNKKQKNYSIDAKIALGISRSSNVNNGLISPEYRLPGLNDIIVEGEEPKADNSHFQMINLNFNNYLQNKSLRIKNSFLVYTKTYFNEKDENLIIFSYKPSISYLNKKRKELYTLEFSSDKITKKTNEDFYSFSISPQYVSKDIKSYLKYQRIKYTRKEDEDKDFEKIQLYSKINLFKNINYYIDIHQNKRIKDLRTDIDKKSLGNGINLFYNITPNHKINLNYEYSYSKYKHENFAFETKRKDKKQIVEILFQHKINKSSIINLGTSYTKNNSNQTAYVYDEKKIDLNYLKAFRW
jgi:hypothetical protein